MADNLFDASRLYEALKQYNLVPSYGNFIPGGGKQGLFKNQTNTLVAPFSDKDTMAHELTHAVQYNLLDEAAQYLQNKKQNGKKLTDQEQQYLSAAEQLLNRQWGNVYNYDASKQVRDATATKKLADLYTVPKNKENEAYKRQSADELQAYGVGRMQHPSVGGIPNVDASMTPGANPHLDPTMAQEFDILFSMFNGLPKDLKDSIAASRQQKIPENRQFYSDPMLPYATDLFMNPFPSSIK